MITSTRPEAVFAAPWEARAFALVHDLHARGLFTWVEFQGALAAEIAGGATEPEPSSGSTSVYYKQWFAAALRLLEARGVIDRAALARRRDHLAHELSHDRDHDHP